MSLWLPDSGCGPQCLTATATVSRPRRVGRLLALVAVVLLAAAVLPVTPRRYRARVLGLAARAALRALGVHVTRHGALPAARALVVANHISWLDILVLLGAARARLVAKAEVRDWPLIGALAASVGTIFIHRYQPKQLPSTVAAVRQALAEGAVVAAFPEGTTSCGQLTGAFRPALFQAALDSATPIVPVRLRFTGAGDPAPGAGFLGSETLVESLLRVLAARDLRVRVGVEQAVQPLPGDSRADLARMAGSAIGATLPARPVRAAVVDVPVAVPTQVPALS